MKKSLFVLLFMIVSLYAKKAYLEISPDLNLKTNKVYQTVLEGIVKAKEVGGDGLLYLVLHINDPKYAYVLGRYFYLGEEGLEENKKIAAAFFKIVADSGQQNGQEMYALYKIIDEKTQSEEQKRKNKIEGCTYWNISKIYGDGKHGFSWKMNLGINVICKDLQEAKDKANDWSPTPIKLKYIEKNNDDDQDVNEDTIKGDTVYD